MSRWLFGPAPDLLLGCGLLYALVFLTFAVGGSAPWARDMHQVAPYLLPFFALPHYGATLIRVYERRADRRAHTIFAVHVTIFVFVAFALGIYYVFVGSLLLTIYSTWGPCHYTGQNYGLAVMFLRRRGVDVTPRAKRLLHLSFVLSYLFVILVFHSARGKGGVIYSAESTAEATISFLPLGIPAPLTDVAFPLIAAANLIALGACARLLLRSGSPRDLLPAAALVFTQALWFSLRHLVLGCDDGHRSDRRAPGRHHVHLLGGDGSRSPVPLGDHLLRPWQPGLARLPQLSGQDGGRGRRGLDGSAGPLRARSDRSRRLRSGRRPARRVGREHPPFHPDGAIWKLRDRRIAGVLLRRPDASDAAPAAPRSWVRPLVWGLLCAWLAAQVLGILEYELDASPAMARGDIEGMRAAATRLRWLGRDDAELRFRLGAAAGERGDLVTARREFERMIELQENARGWVGLSFVEVESRRPEAARAALERAVRANPSEPEVWARAAQVWVALGDRERAAVSFHKALALAPNREDLRQQLVSLKLDPAATAIGGRAGESRDPPR